MILGNNVLKAGFGEDHVLRFSVSGEKVCVGVYYLINTVSYDIFDQGFVHKTVIFKK